MPRNIGEEPPVHGFCLLRCVQTHRRKRVRLMQPVVVQRFGDEDGRTRIGRCQHEIPVVAQLEIAKTSSHRKQSAGEKQVAR